MEAMGAIVKGRLDCLHLSCTKADDGNIRNEKNINLYYLTGEHMVRRERY